MNKLLDRQDISILSALVEEPRLPASELGDLVHLSRTAVSRRLVAMKEAGVFVQRPNIVSFEELGFSVRAFVEVYPGSLSASQVREVLLGRPEVIHVYTIAGKTLFLVDVVAVDLARLEDFMRWAQRLGNTETKIVFSESRSDLPLKHRLDAAKRPVDSG